MLDFLTNLTPGQAIFIIMGIPFILATFWPKGDLPYNW